MENKKSLSSSTAWYSIGNFVIRSISFLLLPLYSNLLSTEEFGNYALLISLYTIISVLYQSGMQNSLTKFYLENDDSAYRKKVFSSVFNTIIIIGVLITCLSIIFSGSISQLILGSIQYRSLIELVFLTLFAETLGYFILHLFKTKEEAKKVVIYSLIAAIINLVLNIVFVYYYRLNVEGIFIAQLLSSFVLFILLIPSLLSELQMLIDKLLLKKMFLFSLPFLIAGVFSSAVDVSDRFILNYFTNKSEVGIYSFSYKIAMVMNVFVISFRTAWIPHALNVYHSKNYSEVFGNTFKKLLAVSFLIILVVPLISPFLFKLKLFDVYLLSKNFESGLIILPYVLLGYLFNGVASFYSLYPFESSKSYYFLVTDLLAFLVNIILNFIFIPLLGMVGAALSTTLAFLSAAIFLFIISRRKIVVFYPWKEIILIVLIAGIFLFIGLSFQSLMLRILLIVLYLVIVGQLTKIKMKNLFRVA